jgi:hypothetical protein
LARQPSNTARSPAKNQKKKKNPQKIYQKTYKNKGFTYFCFVFEGFQKSEKSEKIYQKACKNKGFTYFCYAKPYKNKGFA